MVRDFGGNNEWVLFIIDIFSYYVMKILVAVLSVIRVALVISDWVPLLNK